MLKGLRKMMWTSVPAIPVWSIDIGKVPHACLVGCVQKDMQRLEHSTKRICFPLLLVFTGPASLHCLS